MRRFFLPALMTSFSAAAVVALSSHAVLAQDVKERSVLVGHKQEITGLAFTPSGKSLISSSGSKKKSGASKIWDLATGKERFALDTSAVNCVAAAPDGKTWSMGMDGNHSLSLFDALKGKLIGRLDAGSFFSPTWSLAFSADGRSLACGNADSVVVWDMASRKRRWQKRIGDILGEVHGLAWSRDGKYLAAANLSKQVTMWDGATGKIRSILDAHDQAVTTVALSGDGKLLASGSLDKTAKLWKIGQPKILLQSVLEGPKGVILSVAFAPDSRTLASGSADGTVRLWSTSTNKELAVIGAGAANPRGLAFSPDGKTLALGWTDKSIKLFDVEAITKRKK